MRIEIKYMIAILVITGYGIQINAQGLFDVAGNNIDNSGNQKVEINGYGRGSLYIGEKNGRAELSSGYLETALRLKFLPDHSVALFSEARLRSGYEYGSSLFKPSLRELYADIDIGKLDLRIGHQIIAWGRADGINPTDNITPRNYFVRSPEPDDIRLGNYLFRGRYQVNENTRLEGIWVPFSRQSIYRFDLFEMPDYVRFRSGSNTVWESSGNLGLKLEFLFHGVDGSVSWFSGFDPQPGIGIDHLGIGMTDRLTIDLAAKAFRQNMIGTDFATVAGNFGIRGEAGLRIPEADYQDEIFTPATDIRYTLGIDRSIGNFNIMIQYFGQWVPSFKKMTEVILFQQSGGIPLPEPLSYSHIPVIIGEQIKGFNRIIFGQTHRASHTIALRPSVDLMFNTLKIDLFAMYNISTEELTILPRITYSVTDYWSISLGGQFLDGPDNSLNDMAGPLFNGGFLEVRRSF
ncbi:MAG: hypothetical protein AMS27_04995 [Bacteroides sp. SM23_62_1]|nr:MAG: hypothetical protein AMS27_04995 [Bacteroides sp. SM23_62_1]